MVTINISPNPALLDETLRTEISGLRSSGHVTVMCRVHEDGVRYFSVAYYVSDSHGVVNLNDMPALPGGSYDGIEPMGLIWSQKQEPGQKPGRRLSKINVSKPIITHLYVFDGILIHDTCLQMANRQQYFCHVTCDRLHMAPGVERIEVSEGRLRGTMFIPSGLGPFPGVIDLFGTAGGTIEHRSAMLASRGIAAFTVCYFTPGVGEGMITDIEYFEGAIKCLLQHPKVVKPYVGIVGVSKGAELCFLISSLCHQVRACVEINGMHTVTLVEHIYKGETFKPVVADFNLITREGDGLVFEIVHENKEENKCCIPLERATCDFLFVHSGDDRSMPPIEGSHMSNRLQRHGKTNYRLLVLPDAGHLLEVPYSPHFYSSYHALFSNVVIWGGTPRGHARAQDTAWAEMLTFFKNKLSQRTQTKL